MINSTMTNESLSLRAATVVGVEDISALLHTASKEQLVALLERQPTITIPDFAAPLNHSLYETIRVQLVSSATLAALAGDDRLETLVQQLVQLQQGYARQVITRVKEGVR